MRKRLIFLLLLIAPPLLAANPIELTEIPQLDEYCLAAQRLVTRTAHPVELVIHQEFDAFVKSKAVIEGPQIQQMNWYEGSEAVGVSCKLKSADHLNLAFGENTAGPDGRCQDMNRAVYQLIIDDIKKPVFTTVVFDPKETVVNEEEPGMVGPDWLAPYQAMNTDDAGALHIRAKGFQVDFTNPMFAKAPARFRGVHYCHFIAPEYLRRVLQGKAQPDVTFGQLVDTSGYSAPTE